MIEYIPGSDENHRIEKCTTEDPYGVEMEEQEWIPEGDEVVPGWTNGYWQSTKETKE